MLFHQSLVCCLYLIEEGARRWYGSRRHRSAHWTCYAHPVRPIGRPRLPYVPGVQGIGIVMEADKLVPGQRYLVLGDAGMEPVMAAWPYIASSTSLQLRTH